MTVDQIEDLLSRVTYKPGTRFIVSKECDFVTLRIALWVRDADAKIPGELPIVRASSFSPEAVSRWNFSDFLSLIRHELRAMEFHEVDEWFRIDGICHVDPHPELKVG